MPIERIVEEVKVKKSSSSLGGESQEKTRDRSKGRNFQKPALNRKAKVSTKSS
jgi:ribosomal protein L44E